MKINNKYLGLVTKKFNDFFLVDLKNYKDFDISEKFLCKVRKSIYFKDQLIYVGDEVATVSYTHLTLPTRLMV